MNEVKHLLKEIASQCRQEFLDDPTRENGARLRLVREIEIKLKPVLCPEPVPGDLEGALKRVGEGL